MAAAYEVVRDGLGQVLLPTLDPPHGTAVVDVPDLQKLLEVVLVQLERHDQAALRSVQKRLEALAGQQRARAEGEVEAAQLGEDALKLAAHGGHKRGQLVVEAGQGGPAAVDVAVEAAVGRAEERGGVDEAPEDGQAVLRPLEGGHRGPPEDLLLSAAATAAAVGGGVALENGEVLVG